MEHIKVFENSDKKVENIDKIVNDFKNKLIKVEKDLVFIEERYSYLRTDKLVALLNPINERELNDHRDILDRKIDTFLLNIKRFKKSKNLEFFYEVQNVYDKIIQTISDILKFISLLLSEPAPEFLNKIITEYLKSVPIKDEPEGKEETNCSKTKRKLTQEIYDESIDILTTEYLSAIKANRLQYQVRKLCKWGEEYHETIKSKDQKFEELQLKYDLLYEEHKNQLIQHDKYRSEANSTINKLNKNIKHIEQTVSRLIKSSVEVVLEIERSEKTISTLLEEVLNNIQAFDQSKHFKLMDVLENSLKELNHQEGEDPVDKEEFKQLKTPIIDFLYLLKDKHPYSKPEEGKEMDVFNRVMKFMQINNLKPSDDLIMKYSQSEITKTFNDFPSFMDLKDKIGMKREIYDDLKKRYSSKPPFVYFFNPKEEIHTIPKASENGFKFLDIGFCNKEERSIGAVMVIDEDGYLFQGYLKDGYREYYGRFFYPEGNYYIGGVRGDKKHGKGEYQWDEGDRLIANWVDDNKEGAAKYYDEAGEEVDRVYKEGKRIE